MICNSLGIVLGAAEGKVKTALPHFIRFPFCCWIRSRKRNVSPWNWHTETHTHTRVPTREKRNEKTRHSIGVYQCASMSKGNYSLSIWKSRSIVIALSDRNFPRIPLKKSVMASPKNMTANSLRLGTSQMRRANCKESTNHLWSIWIDLTDLRKHPKRNMGESWLNL